MSATNDNAHHAFQVNKLLEAFKRSCTLLFGYLPLSAALGFLFVQETGLNWMVAATMNVFIFAGSLQFI